MAFMATAGVAILDRCAARCYRFARHLDRTTNNRRTKVMSKTRIFLTGLAALFVAELLAIAIHGYVLAADYAPYYGTLLRGGADPAWQMSLLPVAHAAFIGGLVWIYLRVPLAGSPIVRGLKL